MGERRREVLCGSFVVFPKGEVGDEGGKRDGFDVQDDVLRLEGLQDF